MGAPREPFWWRVEVRAPRAIREALSALLVELGASGTVVETDALCAYFPPDGRSRVDTRLARYRLAVDGPVDWSWSPVADTEWRDRWKAFFRPAQVSRRLAVCPTWEAWTPDGPGLRVIRLDPGQAFGTGTHETTRLCLSLIDDLVGDAAPREILDVGCGSGILSIGALLLGVPTAVALDVDPVAAAAARRNAATNGVADRTLVVCADPRAVTGRHPLVVANILYQVILGLAPELARLVDDGGRLVVSGMLGPELDSAVRVFRDAGLEELRRETLGEWGALVLGRP